MTPDPALTPFALLDALLIAPFRLLPGAELGFYVGNAVLAVASALLGRAGVALVVRVQRVRHTQVEGEVKRRSDLSIQALQMNDKKSYLAQNNLAQEAYGDSLALAAGRAAALLWPGMLVLTWLSWRFDGVAMPYLWESAGVATVFLPLYLAALFAQARWLPTGLPQ